MTKEILSPEKRINEILIQNGFSQGQLIPSASFTHDLGFDSLDFAEFIMQVEMAFSIAIPIEAVENHCKTIADAIVIVEKQMQTA